MNGIGKRLKQERKRLKLTQVAMGAIGGVEANAQGHYESGQRVPKADYLFRVAAAGVDINRVVTGVESVKRVDVPVVPERQPEQAEHQELESTSAAGVVKIIGQLRQSLWVTASALCEVTRLIEGQDQSSQSDHVEDHLRVLQGDADTFVALALARIQKANHETH